MAPGVPFVTVQFVGLQLVGQYRPKGAKDPSTVDLLRQKPANVFSKCIAIFSKSVGMFLYYTC